MKKLMMLVSTMLVAITLSACGGIDFGRDTGEWTMDRECDDPRFKDVPGTPGGMADYLDEDNILKDATDCEGLMNAGWIEPRE